MSEPVAFTIGTPSGELAGLRAGDGPPIILLHGWPMTSHAWRKVMPALAKEHSVVAFDLPGLGRSHPPAGNYYTTGACAKMIAAGVSALGLEPPVLVGHDIGGMVAASYALLRSGPLQALVVAEAPLPGIGDWEEIQKMFWHFGFHQTADLPEKLVGSHLRDYLSFFYERDATRPDAVSDADLDLYVQAYEAPQRLTAGFDYYRAMDRSAEQNAAALKEHGVLDIPVLALAGSNSNGDRQGTRTSAICQRAKSAVIEDCGHFLPEEAPDDFSKRVLSFLANA